jgi:hypothetical protein
MHRPQQHKLLLIIIYSPPLTTQPRNSYDTPCLPPLLLHGAPSLLRFPPTILTTPNRPCTVTPSISCPRCSCTSLFINPDTRSCRKNVLVDPRHPMFILVWLPNIPESRSFKFLNIVSWISIRLCQNLYVSVPFKSLGRLYHRRPLNAPSFPEFPSLEARPKFREALAASNLVQQVP